jgi:hypothetical protein
VYGGAPKPPLADVAVKAAGVAPELILCEDGLTTPALICAESDVANNIENNKQEVACMSFFCE